MDVALELKRLRVSPHGSNIYDEFLKLALVIGTI
jgi:hypothetical protein